MSNSATQALHHLTTSVIIGFSDNMAALFRTGEHRTGLERDVELARIPASGVLRESWYLYSFGFILSKFFLSPNIQSSFSFPPPAQ